jgi:hypothetical protein
MEIQHQLHYKFTYFALPFIVLSKVDDTYRKLKPYSRTAYLLSLWNGLAEKLKEDLKGRSLVCQKLEMDKNNELYMITMSTPQNHAEAYFIGILYEMNHSLFKKSVEKVRYFTLEKSWDFENNYETYVIGEMDYGPNILNLKHINHGFIEKNDIKIFPQAIKEILINNKKGDYWRKTKFPPNDQIPSEKKESPPTELESQKDEIEELWAKWENDNVISSFKDQSIEIVEPLYEFLMELRNIAAENKIFSDLTMNSIDETIKGAMLNITKGSIIVGLEYPDFSDSPESFRGSKADLLLEECSKLSIQIFTLLISKVVERKLLNNKQMEHLAKIMGDQMYEVRLKCYLFGAEVSPNKYGNYWKYKTFSEPL